MLDFAYLIIGAVLAGFMARDVLEASKRRAHPDMPVIAIEVAVALVFALWPITMAVALVRMIRS
jgi:hypothetical protein